MTKLLQKAFDEASKLPKAEQDALGRVLLDELASERRWEELFSGSHDLLAALAHEALAEHALSGPKNLIPTNCDFAHHGAVPEDVQRTACRGSAPSPPCLSDFSTEPESTEPSFQTGSSYAANLFCSNRPRLSSSEKVTKSYGIGSALTLTMTDSFRNRGVDSNHWVDMVAAHGASHLKR